MDNYQKLDKIMDWEIANYTLSTSEKHRLKLLSADEFMAELDRMAKEYHFERYVE